MAKNDRQTPAREQQTIASNDVGKIPTSVPAGAPSAASVPANNLPTQETPTMNTAATGAFRRPTFTVKKILTLPLLKLEAGKPVYVQFQGPIFTGKKLTNAAATDAEKAKLPPEMANVVNLETGELCQIMLGKVLHDLINEEYPQQSYVGKGFMLELTEKKRGRNGNNYNTYKLAEVELQPTAA